MWCSVLASSLARLILGMVAQYFVVAASERHFCSKGKKKLNEQAAQMRLVECLPSRTISVLLSHSSSSKPSLQSEREDLRQAPSTFCLALPFSDTLFGVCVFLLSVSSKTQSLSSALLTLNSVLSLNDRSVNGIRDIFTCYMATQREMLSSNSNAHFAY